jgi:hypothetical protein
MKWRQWICALTCLTIAIPASAYIGPGAGISFIGSLFSALLVVFLSIAAVLSWPLRYLWRRTRRLIREARGLPPITVEGDKAEEGVPPGTSAQQEAASARN